MMATLLVPSVQSAVILYDLTITGSSGTTGTGSFSFDDTVVGPNYFGINSPSGLLSLSMTLNVSGGTPSTTTFDLSDSPPGTAFLLITSPTGEVLNFNPYLVNDDGYSTGLYGFNQGLLNPGNEILNYTFGVAAVPEPADFAAMMGAGLFGFAMWRHRHHFRRPGLKTRRPA
jgi:hypothetical protein